MKLRYALPLVGVLGLGLAACAPMQPNPEAMSAKLQNTQFQVLENNKGKYMSPYTSDGVTAEWVNKSINAQMGSAIGGAVGAYAGQKALEQVPFVGGFLGQKMGAEAGRRIALESIGGEAYMRETSDLSFNDINQMAGWLIKTHASNEKFAEVMKATSKIYPELPQAQMAIYQGRY